VHSHSADAAAQVAATWSIEPRYRPSAQLERHIIDRDQHCMFPGCTAAARWCDVEHTIPWPTGPTHPANLALICRRHHRFKQSARVTVVQPTPGHLRWMLPTGHQYEVGPPG
jgi:hypothetical protein